MTADTVAILPLQHPHHHPHPHHHRHLEDDVVEVTDCSGRKRHSLPVLKVTLPEDPVASSEDSPTPAEQSLDDLGPLWKLDRRDSGSLFWRRDSVANRNSKVKFRCDVDVLEFSPREGENVPDPVPDSASEDEDDIYNDDYILLHGEDECRSSSWLRPSNLFGRHHRLRRSLRRHDAGGRESSVLTSLVCVFAILITAYVQFTFVR